MPAVAVDTDVVSFLFERDTRAWLYQLHLSGKLLFISFMTLAELYRWGRERNWGQPRRLRFDRYLRRFVVRHEDRALCLKWAEVANGAQRKEQPISTADAWNATGALALGVPLVTHNPAD